MFLGHHGTCNVFHFFFSTVCDRHTRRRMNTEEKATVFASVWGTEFIQFPAALAISH